MRIRLPLFIFGTFLSFSGVLAQGGKEAKVSLQSNPRLAAMAGAETPKPSIPVQAFGKASIPGQRFPFIERFAYPGTEITDSLWDLKAVKKQGSWVVLNAQNQNGLTYSNGDGTFRETDVLLSRDIDVRGSNGKLYIAFAYSTGSTWQSGDSLVAEVETPSGTYVPVWTAPNAANANIEVRVPLDLQLYYSASLNFRIRCFSTALATNTETFLLSNIVLADKLDLPLYENFYKGGVDSTRYPATVTWQQAQTRLADTPSYIGGTRVALFDSKDINGTVYNNGGFADTLHLQPVDLLSLASSDSVYLRFYYRALPSAGSNDSLILEFLNNLGMWVRVWQTGAAAQAGFVPFIEQINAGRYRHANFQCRFINKCSYSPNDTAQFAVTGFHIGRKLLLPFVDDFSSTSVYPSQKNWTDRYVFINNDYPVRPPSYNVATFDGLDARGNAYGQGNGSLDTLTSAAIRLNSLSKTDSTYLSFFVEPQGLGDKPNNPDSLILEFRSHNVFSGAWQTVWNASASSYRVDSFTQVFVFVDSAYLHDDFQFRFRNLGSRTGNLDQWHVDYVRMDRGRRPDDAYYDFAVTGTPPSLLQKYASMPRRHFDINPAAYTNTIQSLGVSNNSSSAFPLNFRRTIFDPSGNDIDLFANTSPNIPARSDAVVLLNSTPVLATSQTADSLVFKAWYHVSQGNNFDNIPSNDSAKVETIFSNYFAYDDGTAEAGYGIEIEPGGVALGFNLEVADTLRGLSMYFNQSFTDVSTQSFNLMVWSAIGTNGNGTGETVLKRILQSRPSYMNTRNGFYYLEFDQYLVLPAGKFYIGWEQTTPFQLNMGFDQNYRVNGVSAVNPEMYYRLQDNIWQRTKIAGALMMRPIVGKWITPPVGIREQQTTSRFNVEVYPNPASDMLFIDGKGLHATLFDLAGKQIMAQNVEQNQLFLPSLSEGLYLLKLTETASGESIVKKIIIKQ
jgi:hypothetical protein